METRPLFSLLIGDIALIAGHVIKVDLVYLRVLLHWLLLFLVSLLLLEPIYRRGLIRRGVLLPRFRTWVHLEELTLRSSFRFFVLSRKELVWLRLGLVLFTVLLVFIFNGRFLILDGLRELLLKDVWLLQVWSRLPMLLDNVVVIDTSWSISALEGRVVFALAPVQVRRKKEWALWEVTLVPSSESQKTLWLRGLINTIAIFSFFIEGRLLVAWKVIRVNYRMLSQSFLLANLRVNLKAEVKSLPISLEPLVL